MGSAKSKVRQVAYRRGDYQAVLTHSDPNMGSYSIIKFGDGDPSLCLSKVIDPSVYDKYSSDVDEFGRKLAKQHPGICDFLFLEANRQNAETYDVVFEFADCINTHFQSEKVIWAFIGKIISALSFLQEEGFHYPLLRKRFTVYHSATDSFKLLNPNCFPAHVESVIGTYLNTQVPASEKKSVQDFNVQRNIKELGIMVLALIKNVDESTILRSPSQISAHLKSLTTEHGYSPYLANFLIYAIENRNQMSFLDLQKFVELGGLRQFFESQLNPGVHSPTPYSGQMNFVGTEGLEDQLSRLRPRRDSQNIGPMNRSSIGLGGSRSVSATPVVRAEPERPTNEIETEFEFHETAFVPKPKEKNPLLAKFSVDSATKTPQNQVTQNSAPLHPTKPVKRIFVRWCQETNSHKEFLEFEDGTTEESKPKSVQESQKLLERYTQKQHEEELKSSAPPSGPASSPISAIPSTPTSAPPSNLFSANPPSNPPANVGPRGQMKKSVMGSYNIKEVKSPIQGSQEAWKIILFSDANEPAKIIFTALVKNHYNSYDHMKGVVNRKDPLKVSIYHQLEDEVMNSKAPEPQSGEFLIQSQIRSLETHPFTVQRN